MDVIRSHSWLELVASDALVADAAWVIEQCGSAVVAADWTTLIDELRVRVDHPTGDHPALASALHANAAHVLSLDDRLISPETGARIRRHVQTSIKRPAAFVSIFDPASLYAHVVGDTYPGPDRDPRS